MLEMHDALLAVLDAAHASASTTQELIRVHEALGRVAAEPVVSRVAVPPALASTIDGFAVRFADGADGPRHIIGAVRAGQRPSDTSELSVSEGECVYITTGACLPVGADAVVMIEDTCTRSDDDHDGIKTMTIRPEVGARAVSRTLLRPPGSDLQVGDVVIHAGEVLTSTALALAVMAGVGHIPVRPLVKVGVLSTGDELAALDDLTSATAVFDSNRPMLQAALANLSCGQCLRVTDLGQAADTPEAIDTALRSEVARACDLLFITGGVSMGDRDFVKPWLAANGSVRFGRLRMKPGKPTCLATISRAEDPPLSSSVMPTPQVVLALPGNPVSAAVTFELFGSLAARVLAGETAAVMDSATARRPGGVVDAGWSTLHEQFSPCVTVRMAHAVQPDAVRCEYRRAIVWQGQLDSALVVSDSVDLWAADTGPQGSSRLLSLRGANALIFIPSDTSGDSYPQGTRFRAVLTDSLVSFPPPWVKERLRLTPTAAPVGCRCDAALHDHLTTTAAQAASPTLRALVITVSDRCSRGEAEDTSGPELVGLVRELRLKDTITHVSTALVPDDLLTIRDTIIRACDDDRFHLVITTGGTGFGPRDVTPEATAPVLERRAPGLVHAMFAAGLGHTPLAVLARYEAGTRDRTLIVNFPGSRKAVRECWEAIAPILPHALQLLRPAT